MIRCRTCCYPNTKPDIYFDETGQCSACISYFNRPNIDYEARNKKLIELLDKYDGRVIVPSSGGKDSTYIALRLKQIGADVTAVTATTCHLTDVGRRNIDNLSQYVRTIEITPNMQVRAKLNKLSFEMVGDAAWPEHASIHRIPFRVARDTKHHLLMYGECGPSTYGGPAGTEDIQIMSQRFVSEFGGFLGLRPVDFVGMDGITERDMLDYQSPDDNALAEHNITAYFLGWFEPWDSHRNAKFAAEHGMIQKLPCSANWWEAENQDNAQCGPLHDYPMFRKYGYGRGCAQISADVRAGLVPRDVALKWIEEHDGVLDEQYMGVQLDDILDRINLTRSRFFEVMDRFTDHDLFLNSSRITL